MNESYSYLHLLLQEPIYLISDQKSVGNQQQDQQVSAPAEEIKPLAVPTPELKPLAVFIETTGLHALPESQKIMLTKLLQAAKVDSTQADFLPNQDFATAAALYKKCLVFNSALGQAKYRLIQHAQSKVLIADSLVDLENNVELKRQLWPQVQKLFGLVD